MVYSYASSATGQVLLRPIKQRQLAVLQWWQTSTWETSGFASRITHDSQEVSATASHRILVFRLTMSGSGASFSWGAPEWSHGSLVQGERQILMCPGTRISWTGSNGEEGRPDPVRGQGDLLLIFYPPWYLPGPSRGGRHGHPESQLRQLRGYDTPNESGPGRFFGT